MLTKHETRTSHRNSDSSFSTCPRLRQRNVPRKLPTPLWVWKALSTRRRGRMCRTGFVTMPDLCALTWTLSLARNPRKRKSLWRKSQLASTIRSIKCVSWFTVQDPSSLCCCPIIAVPNKQTCSHHYWSSSFHHQLQGYQPQFMFPLRHSILRITARLYFTWYSQSDAVAFLLVFVAVGLCSQVKEPFRCEQVLHRDCWAAQGCHHQNSLGWFSKIWL